jgi:hypothetical protein
VLLYKPELGFWEFMELQHKEPEFWWAYVDYRLEIHLGQIHHEDEQPDWEYWELYLVKRCTATTCSTIAKNIMAASNGTVELGWGPRGTTTNSNASSARTKPSTNL